MAKEQTAAMSMKKKGLLLLGFLIFCSATYYLFQKTTLSIIAPIPITKSPKENPVWLNVFVHGTVGSSFSLLNLKKVAKDEIKGTRYKKIVSSTRSQKGFWQDQPILSIGLEQINPTFNTSILDSEDYYLAAYPIISAFEAMQIQSGDKNKDTDHLYYLYGWSGLLSQEARRKEGIRLYNALNQKVFELTRQGYSADKIKVRILTHSHGGNVCLSMAGAYHTLTDKNFYDQFSIGESIKSKFEQIISNLPARAYAETKKHPAEKYDYPPKRIFQIDELICLGTPIQKETVIFFKSPLFKKKINLYSEGDVVQTSDFVSTEHKTSYRKASRYEVEDSSLFEIKINIRDFVSQKIETENKIPSKQALGLVKYVQSKFTKTFPDINPNEVAGEKVSTDESPAGFVDLFFGLKNTSRKSSNPTHKELWFFVPPESKDAFNFLRPIPVFCFYPFVDRIINEKNLSGGHYDLIMEQGEASDLAIKLKSEAKDVIEGEHFVKTSTIIGLKEKLAPWTTPKEITAPGTAEEKFAIKLRRAGNKVNL